MHKKSCRRRRVVGCCFSVIMPLLTPRGGTRVAPEGAAPASTVDTPQPNTSFSEGTAMSAFAQYLRPLADLPEEASGPAGALVFTLHRGKDLVAADRNGRSDPYCIVKPFTCETWRSRVVYKTLNPVWEQKHEFDCHLMDVSRKPLSIRVYDFDILTLNDPIGTCRVDISALLTSGRENGLTFDDVPLQGVKHGSISFSLRFELKPVFALFPGTPVHASAAQALRRRPPADATCLEILRDGVLRLLSRKIFLYLAITWLVGLVVVIGFIVVFFSAMLLPAMTGAGTPREPPLAYAGWSREARLIGLSDADLMFWSNFWIQVINAFFSYLNLIVLPWRLSIAMHHCSRRSSAPGCDFYGRPTEAIWFHIPERSRKLIALNLLLSCAFHFATQATRFVYPDYVSSNSLPGVVPVNVTFVLSIVFAICAAIVQGRAEKRLQTLHPDRFPPGISRQLKEVWRRYRKGEVRLCSRQTLRDLFRAQKEQERRSHIAKEMRRLSEESRRVLPLASDRDASLRSDDGWGAAEAEGGALHGDGHGHVPAVAAATMAPPPNAEDGIAPNTARKIVFEVAADAESAPPMPRTPFPSAPPSGPTSSRNTPSPQPPLFTSPPALPPQPIYIAGSRPGSAPRRF